MIIKNSNLIESIETAITAYNNQFYKEEDADKQISFNTIEYSEDGESINIPKEILKKLKTLSVSLVSRHMEKEELQETTNELSEVLDVLNLQSFNLVVRKKGSPCVPLDTSFLEHLNENLKHLSISGIDLSQEEPSRFKRFQNLKNLNLLKCNISDPKIISEVNPDIFVSLEYNQISPEHYEDALNLIQNSNGKIRFSVPELETLSRIYSMKQIKLSDYLHFIEVTNLDRIPQLTLEIDDELDFQNMDNKQIVDMLNSKANISIHSSATNLSQLDVNGTLKVPTQARIKNASELTVEELSKHPCITSIQIQDEHHTPGPQETPYTKEEYEKVRSEIDKIISQIEFPEANDPHRGKKIFAQVYKILGQKIDYDDNAISEEEKNNEKLQTTCRNLLGGLLENKCVCAGYSDILRNVLSCTGIYSEYVGALPDFENGVPMNLKDPKGHAWNLVRLDGQKYWTDLTWDADNIKAGRYPLPYCLKSTEDFKHSSFKQRLEDAIKDPCTQSISDEEQVMLLTGKELEDTNTIKKQENKNIGYLSSCVMRIANSGLTSGLVRKTANELNNRSGIMLMNTNERVVDDARS